MFANLKNKLIEEVKASPSKFQQLAAQAQAAVSSSTSTTPSSASGSDSTATTTTNENFFSITEEDTPQNTPLRLPLGGVRGRSAPQALNNGATSTGAIPRTRKLSNSSMASDISFRLPSYDGPATYHLQSDLESEIGSEFGDEATSPNKLEVITKEKLFEAYKKSLERYNKYRCRYTDLVKQYKELERDSTKARAVLMETQEKALRRINELREQCSLEQGAKAHLEQALRIEMDDMKCKLQAYETKLKLLGENPESIKITSDENVNESLIDLGNETQTTTINGSMQHNEVINLEEAQNAEMKSRILELEKELKICEKKCNELNEKFLKSTVENEQLKKQEAENALLLAETKQAIHTELEAKENEVKRLQEELKQNQNELQNLTKKEAQMNGQLSEIKDLREKLKQSAAAKQEVDAKLIAVEHMFSTLKQQNATAEKSQQSIDEKIKENEHKLQDLRQQNAQLNEMLQRYQQNEVSLAEVDNELNRTKNENDNLRTTLHEYECKVEAVLNEFKEYKEISEKERQEDHDKLDQERKRIAELQLQIETEIVEREKHLKQIRELETELQTFKEQNLQAEQEKLSALRSELQAMHEMELQKIKEQLNNREKDLKSSGNKVAKHKKHHETQQHKIKEQNEELEKLRDELNKHAEHLQGLHAEARVREEQTEVEKAQLKAQITNIVQEISLMGEQMRVVEQSHAELEAEKIQLELHIENMQRDSATAESARLIELERKLQNMESENSQLAERNCLLQENLNRLEKVLAEQERQQSSALASESELRSQLETAESTIQKLNEKMTQVLDENSHMQNAQELMDHDYRTLQDKFDALEKDKLMAEDARNLLGNELEHLRSERIESDANLNVLQQKIETLNKELDVLRKEREDLLIQSEELQSAQDDILILREQLYQAEFLKKEFLDKDESVAEALKQKEQEIKELKIRCTEFEMQSKELENIKEEMERVSSEKESVCQELDMVKEQLNEKIISIDQLEKRHLELENLKDENENSKENEYKLREELEQKTQLVEEKINEIEKLREQMSKSTKERFDEHEALKQELSELIDLEHRAVEQLEEQKSEQVDKIDELVLKLQAANADIEKLHENNVSFQLEIEKLNGKHQLEVQELTTTLRRLQEDHSKLQEHIKSTNEKVQQLNDYEQLKIENEYLTKNVQQLEDRLAVYNNDTLTITQESDELKEKLKSIQCELYVLKENALKHETQLHLKQNELDNTQAALNTLKSDMEAQRLELTRQLEHASYVTQQNDSIQKELLHTQHILAEAEQKLQANQIELERVKETAATTTTAPLIHDDEQLEALKEECSRNRETIEALNKQVSELTTVLQEKESLETQLKALKVEEQERLQSCESTATTLTSLPLIGNAIQSTPSNDAEQHLRELNATLQQELEKLKQNSTSEIISLQHEIEDFKRTAKENSERIIELESIRAGPQMQELFSNDGSSIGLLAPKMQHETDTDELMKNNAELESKLKEIMSEVHDVSNRNLFLEQKCENFLILEQSNERLKSQNAKLSRQLDETLVSMQHSEGMNANTEFEYLRNIMFQYLTGTANGNNETLVKVISAVLKFSPQQTQVALEKEHQRRSLINKIL